MKTIICSHGFAVRADSLGMFTDISEAFPEYDFRMFDYYDIQPNGDQSVRPLEEQTKLLEAQIDTVEDNEIVLLCHSQGSTVAGLADLTKVSKVILMAPPVKTTKDGILNRLRQRKGSKLDPYAMSIVPRSDGTTMYVPAAYLNSLEQYDRMTLFQHIADNVQTVVIRATEDEVLGLTNVNEIKNARHIDIAADHNFTGKHRQQLIEVLRVII
jgi:hypothetical protein